MTSQCGEFYQQLDSFCEGPSVHKPLSLNGAKHPCGANREADSCAVGVGKICCPSPTAQHAALTARFRFWFVFWNSDITVLTTFLHLFCGANARNTFPPFSCLFSLRLPVLFWHSLCCSSLPFFFISFNCFHSVFPQFLLFLFIRVFSNSLFFHISFYGFISVSPYIPSYIFLFLSLSIFRLFLIVALLLHSFLSLIMRSVLCISFLFITFRPFLFLYMFFPSFFTFKTFPSIQSFLCSSTLFPSHSPSAPTAQRT
jgi:hypothetical protein